MRRRDFLIQIGAAVAWPLAAQAQEAGRTYRVGAVSVNPRNAPIIVAIFDELQRLGFIEGQNLTIDWRTYGPRADLVLEFEALGKTKADVIYAGGLFHSRSTESDDNDTDPRLCRRLGRVGAGELAAPPGRQHNRRERLRRRA